MEAATTLEPVKPEWNFWLPDEDRSAGWTNHCYVLQFVCAGEGDTPEEAWEHAKTRTDGLGVPTPDETYGLTRMIATRTIDERMIERSW